MKAIKNLVKRRISPDGLNLLQRLNYEIHLVTIRIINCISPSRVLKRRRLRAQSGTFLHWGCGARRLIGWINIDGWPSPATDYVHDLRKPVPFRDQSVELIFTEHVLEHIHFDDARQVLADFHRILKPGGKLRIVVPGLQECLRAYEAKNKTWFESVDGPCMSVGEGLNKIFYSHFHRFIYDYETLKIILENVGFSEVEQSSHLSSSDPRLRVDSDLESRSMCSLYLEAVK